MGQIIGYMVVLSLSLVILLPITITFQDKIIGTTKSVADITEQANLRAIQNINPTLVQSDGSTTQIYVSNVGLADVTVIAVLLDGDTVTYTFEDQLGNPITTIIPKQLAVIDITGTGNLVQVISQSGKLFEIDVS